MNAATCTVGECTKRVMARGLCSPHYQRARRRAALPPLQPTLPASDPHRLSNINKQQRTADCSVCGPQSRIRLRADGRRECLGKERVRPTPTEAYARKIRDKYGLEYEKYQAMSREQGGRCTICQATPRRLAVDHCHATGRIRGLLCNACNLALGSLRDDPVRALAAAIYLLDTA